MHAGAYTSLSIPQGLDDIQGRYRNSSTRLVFCERGGERKDLLRFQVQFTVSCFLPYYSDDVCSFSIRQKHIEDTLRAAIAEMDPTAVHAPAILTALAVVTSNDHPIQATVEENESASVVQWYAVAVCVAESTPVTNHVYLANISSVQMAGDQPFAR